MTEETLLQRYARIAKLKEQDPLTYARGDAAGEAESEIQPQAKTKAASVKIVPLKERLANVRQRLDEQNTKLDLSRRGPTKTSDQP